jgi:DNA-binding transcriptional MerR regulator
MTGRLNHLAVSVFEAERTYTTREVSEMTQVKVRNVQYWDEQGVVSPQQDKHRRMYLPEEVVTVAVIAELRQKGLTLREMRKISRGLKRKLSKLLVPPARFSKLFLLTDGKSICLEHKADRIIAILAKSRVPMSLVCVTEKAACRAGQDSRK